jgi:hypothetical protein
MKLTSLVCIGAVALGSLLAADGAFAASKKKNGKRSNYTVAQQKEIYKRSLEGCRKKYGTANVHHVEIDYYHMRTVCYIEH